MGYDFSNSQETIEKRDVALQGADDDFGAWELGDVDVNVENDRFFE